MPSGMMARVVAAWELTEPSVACPGDTEDGDKGVGAGLEDRALDERAHIGLGGPQNGGGGDQHDDTDRVPHLQGRVAVGGREAGPQRRDSAEDEEPACERLNELPVLVGSVT